MCDKEPRTNLMGNGFRSNFLKFSENVLLDFLNKSLHGHNDSRSVFFELWGSEVPDFGGYWKHVLTSYFSESFDAQ